MKTLIIALCLLAFIGCSVFDLADDEVSKLKKPVYIVTCNEDGLTLRDSEGKVLFFNKNYYIAKSAFKEGLKRGDVYLP
jgi:hypothetical protein